MKKEGLGDRMKGYENVSRIYLQPKSYVVIRLDGKSFHTYTKKFEKPFDKTLISAMQESLKFVCDSIQCAKLGYTQSDEASIVITDTDTITTQPYFMNNLQKIISISASMFTAKFNSIMFPITGVNAIFDSRAFTIPKEEVSNYFLWRQKDWLRNSVNMLAQSKFSHGFLQGKNTNEVKQILFENGIVWEELDGVYKNGSFYKNKRFSFDKHNYESLDRLLFNNEEVMEDKEINVLSLFDGISTARLVLSELGVKVGKYFSSEIDSTAIAIGDNNFKDITRIGSITEVKYLDGKIISDKNEEYEAEIDLLCGGSSCQNFSFAGKQQGMITDGDVKIESLEQYLEHKENGFAFKGESYLFWEYIRLLKEVKPKRFFLENVKMSKYNKDLITESLMRARYGEDWEAEKLPTLRQRYINEDSRILEFNEAERYLFTNTKTGATEIFSVNYINSGMFSAQTRRRIYWTNIIVDNLPEQSTMKTMDIIEGVGEEVEILSDDERDKLKEFGCSYSFGGRTVHLREKFPTITASYGKVSGNGGKLWLKEILEVVDFKEIPSYMFSDYQGKPRMDCLKDEDSNKFNTITTGAGHPKMHLLNKYRDKIRVLTVTEVERLMGMPDGYTKGFSRSSSIKCLGNGWEKNTILFLWKNLLTGIVKNTF